MPETETAGEEDELADKGIDGGMGHILEPPLPDRSTEELCVLQSTVHW